MEEKKNANDSKEVKKLSYEQLEEVARQIANQRDGIYKENQQLKQALYQASASNAFKDLELRFKVLNYKDLFSKNFVSLCIRIIEDSMTPQEQGENTEERKEKETPEK